MKASAEPTSGLHPSTPEGELGAGDEVDEEIFGPPLPEARSAEGNTTVPEEPADEAQGSSSSASGSAARAGRGPDRGPRAERNTRAWRDAGTGESLQTGPNTTYNE